MTFSQDGNLQDISRIPITQGISKNQVFKSVITIQRIGEALRQRDRISIIKFRKNQQLTTLKIVDKIEVKTFKNISQTKYYAIDRGFGQATIN